MSGFKLFFPRLVANWIYQWRIFRIIADWTIIIYLMIPAAVVFLAIYRSWWLETPDWAVEIPLVVYFLPGYLLSWQGNCRFFTEEADLVFLIKRKSLFQKMKLWGFFYSLLAQAVFLILFIILLLPFLRGHFQLSGSSIAGFFLLLLALKYVLNYIRFHLRRIDKSILRIFAGFFVFIGMTATAVYLYFLWAVKHLMLVNGISFVIIALSVWLYYRLLKRPSLFEVFLTIDREQKLKTAGIIYQFSGQIEKTSVIKRRRPWLFRNSGMIFRERTLVHGFMEMFIKFFLRNKIYLSSYLRMISVTAAAIIIAPSMWIKILIFIVFSVTVNVWFESVWNKTFKEQPLVRKYIESDGYFLAKGRMVNGMVLFSVVLMIILGGGGTLAFKSFVSFYM